MPEPHPNPALPGLTIEPACVGWYAYDDNQYDGPESPLGHGKTPQLAVDDLCEQLGIHSIEVRRG